MTRMIETIEKGGVSLGVWIKGGPHLVSTLARAGFDFVRPDMMFSGLDWKELEHIQRACEATGLTNWVRVAANPWAGGTSQMQVTVDAARAFSLGIPAVDVSVASAEQVRALVDVTKDWHRSGAGEYPSSQADFEAQGARVKDEALIIPSIESATAIAEIDEMLEIVGLRAIMIACTDFSKQVGHPFDYEHPEVWKAMDRIIRKAQDRGIVVAANTGYAFNTPDAIRGRIERMVAHGIRIVMIQGAEFLLESYSRTLIADIRGDVGELAV